jgi:hypothetical protein
VYGQCNSLKVKSKVVAEYSGEYSLIRVDFQRNSDEFRGNTEGTGIGSHVDSGLRCVLVLFISKSTANNLRAAKHFLRTEAEVATP